MDHTAAAPQPASAARLKLQRRYRPEQWLIAAALALLTLFFAAELLFSLSWRMVHDTPNLHYVAWLIDAHGLAPYRDIFEANLPGIYLFHLAIGKTAGYGDIAFRAVDTLWLLALLALVWALMRRFGRLVGWAAAVLFGLTYLQQGPDLSLQRDYLGLLPIMLAIVLATAPAWERRRVTPLLAGLLFGLAAAIKPQLLVGLPLLLIYGLVSDQTGRPFSWRRALGWSVRAIALTAVGVAIPVGLSLFWVWQEGAWAGFVDLFRNYLPLYLQLGKDHRIVTGMDRLVYLVKWFRHFGELQPWLVSATLGLFMTVFVARFENRLVRTAVLLGGLVLAYSIYPVFSGQFFTYHWLPLQFFLVLASALVLVPLPGTRLAQRLFGPAVLAGVLALMLLPAPDFFTQLTGGTPRPPKGGQVDRIVEALETAGYRTGDAVQPLDWTGGTNQALLMLRAPIATRYVYDFYFEHHINSPVIQAMRRDFMAQLRAHPPAFVVKNDKTPRVNGPNTSAAFPELDAFLAQHYEIAVKDDDITVYRRP